MNDHMTTRRIFLQKGLTLLAVTPTIPTFLDQTVLALANPEDVARTQQPSGTDGKILVIVQLSGGNDGLNTVIPFADDAYHVERDDLWAIPTAEVPLTSLHRDEVLDEAALPLRYCAYTSCFRREAGSAGKDTRGLLRAHEFDKVELLALVADAEQGRAAQRDVLARSEAVLGDLGLAYRVVDLCAGDLGASAARTWDVEAYAPGVDQWLEVSSVSWFSDYQARRANIRYRPLDPEAKGTVICHTVNGSAMGWPRTVAAYLETHRQPDGSVAVVEALRSYLGGATHIPVPGGGD